MTETGMGSIGLVWSERRPINSLELQFTDSARMPSVDDVKVQIWVGTNTVDGASDSFDTIVATLWHGHWVTLLGPIERQDDRWRLRVDLKATPAARESVHKFAGYSPRPRRKSVSAVSGPSRTMYGIPRSCG